MAATARFTVILVVRSLLCAVAAFGLAACSANRSAAPISPAPSADSAAFEAWHLTFHLSGGFAGLDRTLELASTGELHAADLRRGAKVTTKSPGTEVAQIESVIAKLKPLDTLPETNCRDCLQYDIEVEMSSDPLVLHLNDVSLAGAADKPLLEALVKTLTSLLDRALAGQLNLEGMASHARVLRL